jgi:hypothetical protein
MQFNILIIKDIMISTIDKFILRYHDINTNESDK